MATDDGSILIIYNGEIYNFRELRTDMEEQGHRFRGNSDTEVLLALYRRHGAEMLPRLNGIFAFAAWNKRDKSLFVARDALGVKPLYFSETPRGFAFASEMKALLAMVPEARQLDVPSLHRYLSFLWCPGEGTPLRAVRKLGPGEWLRVNEGKIVARTTWYELPARRGVLPDLSSGAARAGLVSQLRAAVHRQLVADVPVGAFLSGGLDSSAVVTFARELAPGIRCFSIESAGGEDAGTVDDLPYARIVAKHLGVPLDVVRIDAARMAQDLEGLIAQLDEPLADPAPLNVLYISRLARENGMKVMLSGAGGDDLFTGYRRHTALGYESLWKWMPRTARAALNQGSAKLAEGRPKFRRLAKLFSDAEATGDEALAGYFLWTREAQLFRLYTPEFRHSLAGESALTPMLDFLAPIPPSVSRLERILALEQRFFLADHNLIYTDKMSMAAGVEVRVPFLDPDLVEFAARIPARVKQRGRVGKLVLKQAMEPFLPHDVIYRPKTGFGAPLRRWLRGDLRGMLHDILSEKSLSNRGLFDPKSVHQLIADNESGKVDAAYILLSLMSIEIWCRAFLDSNGRYA